MDSLEKFLYWEIKAYYDLETARAMFQTGRYLYVVFMAQQAIEKLTKGLYVLYLEREPARTHNIWVIFKEILDNNQVDLNSDKPFEAELDEIKSFFSDLLFYYIAERYPDYKQQISSSISEDKARKLLYKTEEVFLWLQSLSQYKK